MGKFIKEKLNIEKPKMSMKKRIIIIVSSFIFVVLIVLLSVFLYINGMLSKIHYSAGTTSSISGTVSDDVDSTSSNSPQSDVDKLEKQIEDNLKNQSTPIAYDEDVFNVLLIGCDTRTEKGPSRSDSMILISINQKSHKIIMTSIMRDIYLGIPGNIDNRINAAYAYGGADLLLKTIQQNFKIRIDKYISVDFFAFMDIINKIGGVNIDVISQELPVMNNYIKEINTIKGLPVDDGFLLQAGQNIKLTGKQAMGYSRIRYVGNDDFGRTQRQRTILTQVYTKIKGQSILKLNDIFNLLLPDLTTNLSKGELYSLLLSSPTYFGYSVEQNRIPVDNSYTDLYIRGMAVMEIDFNKNIAELQAKIYG